MLNDPSNRVIERATFANLGSHSDSSASSAHNLCSKTSEIMQIFFMLYHYNIKTIFCSIRLCSEILCNSHNVSNDTSHLFYESVELEICDH